MIKMILIGLPEHRLLGVRYDMPYPLERVGEVRLGDAWKREKYGLVLDFQGWIGAVWLRGICEGLDVRWQEHGLRAVAEHHLRYGAERSPFARVADTLATYPMAEERWSEKVIAVALMQAQATFYAGMGAAFAESYAALLTKMDGLCQTVLYGPKD